MREIFDQTTQLMEKSWNLWKQTFAKSPWVADRDTDFVGKWSSWLSAMSSSYDVNRNTWKTFVDRSERMFFSTFEQSPFHNEKLEAQWKELWDGLKKAQNLQSDMIKLQLEKMEELLRKSE